ncbi:MAG: hypothetical protein GY754_11895 [bacterium]|nr:hypothetical protein [bacterium]
MLIKTTINFRVSVLEKINEAAASLGVSRSLVIISLLKRVMNKKDFSLDTARAVQYQYPDPDPDNWHTFHINFREDDYEFFTPRQEVPHDGTVSMYSGCPGP